MVKEFDYQEYLASRDWALKKEALLARSSGVCERCYNAPYQETHHKTYARIGNERLEDLLAVCSPCHRYLSAKSDQDPKERKLKPLPLPFHYPSSYDEAQQLACPVCRTEWVHIGDIEHVCSSDCKDYAHEWVRGDVVRIGMWCENGGHHFSLEFGFHKGNTFMRVAPEWSERPEF